MKTAEEFDKEFVKRYDAKINPEWASKSQMDFFRDMCQQIQLDAIKEGMRRAAGITSRYFENNRLHPDIPNENLNESAKMAAHSILQQAAIEIVSVSDGIETKDL